MVIELYRFVDRLIFSVCAIVSNVSLRLCAQSWSHWRLLWCASSPYVPWWRHQMETFSALLAIVAGNSLVTDEFPAQRSVTQGFDVFVDVHLNTRLSKQWWGWWFETPSRPLWCQCNIMPFGAASWVAGWSWFVPPPAKGPVPIWVFASRLRVILCWLHSTCSLGVFHGVYFIPFACV